MKICKTAEDWVNIKAYGTYIEDYKNGEIWESYGAGDVEPGEWYLSHLELDFKELKKLNEFYNNDI